MCVARTHGRPENRTFGEAPNTLFLETDDCRAAHDALLARGVEFTDPPTEQPYGIDCGFRDPFGNNIRLTQVVPMPA